MKLILNNDGSINTRYANNIQSGSNETAFIFIEWADGQEPDILTELLAVDINITYPNNEQSGWQPMTKRESEICYYYAMRTKDLQLNGKLSFVIRWYNTQNPDVAITSREAEILISKGVIAQPAYLKPEEYNIIVSNLTELQSRAFKKYDVNHIDTVAVDYAIDGYKTPDCIYTNFVHEVEIPHYYTSGIAYTTKTLCGNLIALNISNQTELIPESENPGVHCELFNTAYGYFIRIIKFSNYPTSPEVIFCEAFKILNESTLNEIYTELSNKISAVLREAQNYTYSKNEIDQKHQDTLTYAKNYTYSKSDIDAKNIDTFNNAKQYTRDSISGLGNIQVLRGRVDDFNQLPKDPKIGDVYIVGTHTTSDNLPEYVWTGDQKWERVGSVTGADLQADIVSYNNKTEHLDATNVQEAIDELSEDNASKAYIVELGNHTILVNKWLYNETLGLYEYEFAHKSLTSTLNQALDITISPISAKVLMNYKVTIFPHVDTVIRNGNVCAILYSDKKPPSDITCYIKLLTTTITSDAINSIFSNQITFANLSTDLQSKNVQDVIVEINNKTNNKVDKISGKGLSTLDFRSSHSSQISANTSARHEHSNKDILNNITAPYTTEDKNILDNISNLYIPLTQRGIPGGIATLSDNGKIPAIQLPSYVDDVVEGNLQNATTFVCDEITVIPETGKIYVDIINNKNYRWSGSQYVVISTDLTLGETSSTAYAGDKGKQNREDINALLDGNKKSALTMAVAEGGTLRENVTAITQNSDNYSDKVATTRFVYNALRDNLYKKRVINSWGIPGDWDMSDTGLKIGTPAPPLEGIAEITFKAGDIYYTQYFNLSGYEGSPTFKIFYFTNAGEYKFAEIYYINAGYMIKNSNVTQGEMRLLELCYYKENI